jgi:hypothetical protein
VYALTEAYPWASLSFVHMILPDEWFFNEWRRLCRGAR